FCPVGNLQMDGYWIVDGRLHSVLFKIRCELISALATDIDQVVHRCFLGRLRWGQCYSLRSFQRSSVQVGDSSSSLVPVVQFSQLDSSDGSVYSVEPRRIANARDRIL